MIPGPRARFLLYATLLATLTHWPRLRVQIGAIPRPDIVIHVLAFGVWAFLAQRSGLFGPPREPRGILLAAAASFAYAALDEASQAVPVFGRFAVWDDLAANFLGVGLGTAGALVWVALDNPAPIGERGRRER